MPWKGPYEEGVSQSLINKYLECPYRFYLYAILGLEEKHPLEPNLIWGDTFHKGLELLIQEPQLAWDFPQEKWAEIDAALDHHLEQYVPFPPTFPFSIKRMLRYYDDSYKEGAPHFNTERVFAIPYKTAKNEVILRGKLDGDNPSTIVEHKCKGKLAIEQTRDEVPVDLQINMYTYAWQHFYETPELPLIIYDTIRIPDTQFALPQRRMRQSISNYIEELYTTSTWGDFPVEKRRGLWLDQAKIWLTKQGHRDFKTFVLNPLIDLICAWWDHVTAPNFDPGDPACYNEVFYRVPVRHFNPSNTQNFKCNYHSFLTGAIDLDELTPVKSYFPELEEPPKTPSISP